MPEWLKHVIWIKIKEIAPLLGGEFKMRLINE